METPVTFLIELFVQLSLINSWYNSTERVEQHRYIPCPLLGTVTHAEIALISLHSLSLTLSRLQQKAGRQWELSVSSEWRLHKEGLADLLGILWLFTADSCAFSLVAPNSLSQCYDHRHYVE